MVSITLRPPFTPGKFCTGGWVGLGVGPDAEVGGKYFAGVPAPDLQVRIQTLY